MAKYNEMNLSEDELRNVGVIKGDTKLPCISCNNPTEYIDYCCEVHICSEECMNKNNERLLKLVVPGEEEFWKNYT